MSAARDQIPRSTMTLAQQRRIGALQAAKALLYGTGTYAGTPVIDDPTDVLEVARWIAGES